MKVKIIIILLILIFIFRGFSEENYRRITISVILIVFHPEETQNQIVDWLDKNNGYFLIRSDDLLTARVPVDKVRAFTEQLQNFGADVEGIA